MGHAQLETHSKPAAAGSCHLLPTGGAAWQVPPPRSAPGALAAERARTLQGPMPFLARDHSLSRTGARPHPSLVRHPSWGPTTLPSPTRVSQTPGPLGRMNPDPARLTQTPCGSPCGEPHNSSLTEAF